MVSFGFSVGDFVAGINLLIDVVQSLNDTNGAQADYEELGRQLKNLRKAFECIEGLSLHATQTVQASAVEAALNDCRLCVDSFVRRNSKFKSLEATSGKNWSLAALKRQGRKVQWALWKKADVAKFQAAIHQHSNAVHMLLASIQIDRSQTQHTLQTRVEQQNIGHKDLTQNVYNKVSDLWLQQQQIGTVLGDGQASLAQTIQTHYKGMRDKIQVGEQNHEKALVAQNAITMQVHQGVEDINSQMRALMAGDVSAFKEQVVTIIEKQKDMIAQLRNIDGMLRVNQGIPAQVLLSKPVVLLDARSRLAPFHVEFIDSVEALIAVLKIRFKDVGLRKIETGEFTLEDSRLKRGLQLTKPWTLMVRPGQHIHMSMIFRLEKKRMARCPSCGEENMGSDLKDVECRNTSCGITYRTIFEERASSSDQSNVAQSAEVKHIPLSDSEPQLEAPYSSEESLKDEMQHYTRLHILTQAIINRGPTAFGPSPIDTTPITATFSRLSHDEELYVMKVYARHKSHCSGCAPPYDVHQRGGSLCSECHQRILDIADDIFKKLGRPFLVLDSKGNGRAQEEIPADCAVVQAYGAGRGLL